MLPNRQDAEDAFQATFLVLAVKPDAVRPPDRVGAWLHGVACRAALKARRTAARRRAAERLAVEYRQSPHQPDLDFLPILDEALLALPEKYRLPVVECHLAGRSRREAAARLGCSEGTLSGRLARALELLALRLVRRGVGIPAAALAGVLSTRPLPASVPANLAASTLSVADLIRDGILPATGSAAALTRGVLIAMKCQKLTIVSALGLAVGALVAALGFLGPNRATADPPLHSPPRLLLVAAPVPQPGPRWEAKHTITREHAVTEVSVQKEFIAFADEGGNVLLWKIGDKEPEVLVQGSKEKNAIGPVSHLTYTPDRKFVYFSANDGKGLWRHEFEKEAPKTYGVAGDTIVHIGFSDDGRTWIETFAEKRSVVWLRPNGWDNPGVEREDMRFDADVMHVVFSPDAKRLAAITDDGSIHIVDREGLKVAYKIEVKNLRAKAIRFSPDGKALAVVGENGFARLYDATTGAETAQLKGPKGILFDVAFSPNGKTVAAGGDDHTAHIWESTAGKSLAVLKGHEDSVRAVAFGRDGRTIVTGSADKTLRVWELAK